MKKIAIILPIGYKGGTLRAAKNLAKGIAYQASEKKDNIQVVFSYHKDGDYQPLEDFVDLLDMGIILRETEWINLSRDQARCVSLFTNIKNLHLDFSEYCIPSDGANDFLDCDLWIIISDRLVSPILAMRMTVFVVFDYIQRYVPEIFIDNDQVWNDQFRNLLYSVQHADMVMATTPSTMEDLISYAGVPRDRVCLLDLDFEPLEYSSKSPRKFAKNDYFIWTTNLGHHKNHKNALDALEIYWQEFDGLLDVVVTGVGTSLFNPENSLPENIIEKEFSHIHYFRRKIKENPSFARKIRLAGNVSDRQYTDYLINARFLWHPVIYDNGTFSVIEAAYLGIPSFSSSYPAMEYINRKFKLNILFFDPRSPRTIAKGLSFMEQSAGSISLPDRTSLQLHTWKNNSKTIYSQIMRLII